MNKQDQILENFDPRQCIASKIMRSHRIINSVFRKNLNQFDLSNSQISILFVLSKKKQLRQSELAEIQHLEKSSVSRNLQRLLGRGYLSKGKSQMIAITEKGLSTVAAIVPHWEKAMEEISNKLGKEGVDALGLVVTNLIK